MNVFQEMALSVYSYRSYSQFLKNKKGKVFGFGVLLMAIYFAITMVLPSLIGPGSFLGWVNSLQEKIPDFQLKDGVLWVEDVVKIDTGTSYIYIDTSPEHTAGNSAEYTFAFFDYDNVLIVFSHNFIVKSDGRWQNSKFPELEEEFSKEDVMDFIPWLYVIYAVFLVIAYVWMAAWFFFGVLFVALIGMIIASSMNVRLTFGQLYLLGIYSRTLPLSIKALVSFLPFGIPGFWAVNFGLSVLVLVLAITKMKEQIPQTPVGYPSQGANM